MCQISDLLVVSGNREKCETLTEKFKGLYGLLSAYSISTLISNNIYFDFKNIRITFLVPN